MASFRVYSDELGRLSGPTRRGRNRIAKLRTPRKSKPLRSTPRPQLVAHRTSILLQGQGTLNELAYSSRIVRHQSQSTMDKRQVSDGSGSRRDKPLPPTPDQNSYVKRMQSNPDLSQSLHDSTVRHFGYQRNQNQSMANLGYHGDGTDTNKLHGTPIPALPQRRGVTFTSDTKPALEDKAMNVGDSASTTPDQVSPEVAPKKKSAIKNFFRMKSRTANKGSLASSSMISLLDNETFNPADDSPALASQDASAGQDRLDDYSDSEIETPVVHRGPTLPAPGDASDASNPRLTALPQSHSQYGFPQIDDKDLRRRTGVVTKMKGAFSGFGGHSKSKRATTVVSDKLNETVKVNLEKEILQKRLFSEDELSTSSKPRQSYFPLKGKAPASKLKKAAPGSKITEMPAPNFDSLPELEEDLDFQYEEPPAGLLAAATTHDHHLPKLREGYDPDKPWSKARIQKLRSEGIKIDIAGRLPPMNPLRQHPDVMTFARRPSNNEIAARRAAEELPSPPSTGFSVRSDPVPFGTQFERLQASSALSSYYSEPADPFDMGQNSSPIPVQSYAYSNRHTITASRNRRQNIAEYEDRLLNLSPNDSQSPYFTAQTSFSGRSEAPSSSSRAGSAYHSYSNDYDDLDEEAEDTFPRYGTFQGGVGLHDTFTSGAITDSLMARTSSSLNLGAGSQRLASLPGSNVDLPLMTQSYPGSYGSRRQGLALSASPLKRTVSVASHYELDEESARLFNGRSYTYPPDYSDSDVEGDLEDPGLSMRRLSNIPERNEHRRSGSTIQRSLRDSAASSSGSSRTLRRRRPTQLSASISIAERQEASASLHGGEEGGVGSGEMNGAGEHTCGRRRPSDPVFSIASSLLDEADNYGEDGVEVGVAYAAPSIFSGKAKLVDIPARRKEGERGRGGRVGLL